MSLKIVAYIRRFSTCVVSFDIPIIQYLTMANQGLFIIFVIILTTYVINIDAFFRYVHFTKVSSGGYDA